LFLFTSSERLVVDEVEGADHPVYTRFEAYLAPHTGVLHGVACALLGVADFAEFPFYALE
jgi:hypothetical protein